MNYTIKRGSDILITIGASGTQTRRVMGEDVVTLEFLSPKAIQFEIGDTVEVYSRLYKLNRAENVTKTGNRFFSYSLQFEALFYDLAKVQFRGLGNENKLTEPDFSVKTTAAGILDLLAQNANRLFPGWTVGIVDDTEAVNFTFNNQNCLQVLNSLADQFSSEFWIDNQTIHLQKREYSTGITLTYGPDQGLSELYRGRRTDADLVTRLYVGGGTRNLPPGYGYSKLQMPDQEGSFLEKNTDR